MKLIVGLGNPGREYEKTRHNIGFNVLDLLADKYNITFSENKKFNALEASFNLIGEKVILVKPLTFMNLSGDSVIKYINYYELLLKFNWSMENFVILLYNIFEFINMGEIL